MQKWLIIVCFIFSILSCEKDISFAPDATTAKLVVDAQIENNLAPTVVLTTSMGYFATLDSAMLYNSFVHNAICSISDGTKTQLLKEFKIPLKTGNLYYYSQDPSTTNANFNGILGQKYILTIQYNNQTYTATTTIPLLTKTIDSIWWEPLKNYPDSPKVSLMTRVTDPPGLGNYIRYFTKQNKGQYLPGFNSVFDDQIIDGKTYSVQIDRGVDRNLPFDRANYGYFLKGDTATVKLCNITKETYDFWRTWEFAFSSIGNPFSAPGKVIGNINNDALGSFCGYAAQYKTLIIPK